MRTRLPITDRLALASSLLASIWLHLLVFFLPVWASGSSTTALEARSGSSPIFVHLAPQDIVTIARETVRKAPGGLPSYGTDAVLVPGSENRTGVTENPEINFPDRPAEPVSIEPLIYPEDEWLRKIAGKIVLEIYIDETGVIDDVVIIESFPQGAFEQAVLDALLRSKFLPAYQGGRPVRSKKKLAIEFDPWQPQ